MGGKNQTQTSSQSYTPNGLSQLNSIWDKVQSAASTPYQAYTGQLTAGLDPTQQSGINTINNAQGTAQPYYNQATQYANQAASSITPEQIQKYQSPYTQNVIDATQRNFNESNAQQQQQVLGNAAMQGALGGSRVGVTQSELARQQKLAQDPTIAGLQNQGYAQALQAAQQDRAAQGQAAYSLGSLGSAAQNTAIQGGAAQLGAGAVAQNTNQNALSAQYQQYQQQQAYPYQQAQFLASYGVPTATAMGGSQYGSQTTPGPSGWSQAIGLGTAALGAFSDERVKEDMKPVGKTFDGQPIYSYRYKGSPLTQLGLSAQEVEKTHPEAVGSINGIRTVRYDKATEDAAQKGRFASGGAVNFMDVSGYIPKSAPPQASQPQMKSMQSSGSQSGSQSSSPFSGITSSGLKGAFSGLSDLYNQFKLGDDGLGNWNDYSWDGGTPLAGGADIGMGGIGHMATGGAVSPSPFVQGYESGGATLSPDEIASFSGDGPLSPEMANKIYDTYERAGGGKDVSDSQFVKNSQFGAMPWNSLSSYISKLINGDRFANGGEVPDFNSRWGDVDAASDAFTRPAAVASPIPTMDVSNLGLGKPVDWSPAQQSAPGMVAAGATPQDIQAADFPPAVNVPPVASDAPTKYAATPLTSPMNNGTATEDNGADAGGDANNSGSGSDAKQDNGLFGFNPLNLSPEARQGLIAAGLGMMASRSPFAVSAIGEGGLKGLDAYSQAKKATADQAATKQKIDLEAKSLAQKASQFATTASETTRYHNMLDQQRKDAQEDRRIERAKPFKLGTSVDGRDVMAIRDPKSGEIKVIDSKGKIVDQGSSGGGNDADVSGGAAPVEIRAQAEPASPKARNDAFLSDIAKENPGYAAQIKAVADYMLDPNKVFSMRNNLRDQAIKNVYQYDPTYDSTTFPARNKAVSAFSSGPLANQIRSFDVSISHLSTLDDLVKNLDNTKSPAYNKVANFFKEQFGQEAPGNFNAAKSIVADEIAKGIIGGQTALGDREDLQKRLAAAGSPEQLAGVIRTFKQLLGGQLHGLKKQYEDTTRLKNFDDRLTPATRDEITKAESYHKAQPSSDTVSGFTGRTASGPGGKKLRETSDGKWVP